MSEKLRIESWIGLRTNMLNISEILIVDESALSFLLLAQRI